jgi:hypothetical protein
MIMRRGEEKGVQAHSTHVRGIGTYEDGVERCRRQVTLATGIPREICTGINPGYRDPATANPQVPSSRQSSWSSLS